MRFFRKFTVWFVALCLAFLTMLSPAVQTSMEIKAYRARELPISEVISRSMEVLTEHYSDKDLSYKYYVVVLSYSDSWGIDLLSLYILCR